MVPPDIPAGRAAVGAERVEGGARGWGAIPGSSFGPSGCFLMKSPTVFLSTSQKGLFRVSNKSRALLPCCPAGALQGRGGPERTQKGFGEIVLPRT